MDYKKLILNHAEKNNGIITTKECRDEGIPTIYLTRLVKEGSIKRISRGVYQSEEGIYDEYYFLQQRYKQIVYSYETALFFHGLIDLIPKTITVSVPYSYKINVVPENVIVRYVKEDIINLGMTEVKTNMGNKIRTYDKERTIIDIIINQDYIDRESYLTAIRNYIRSSEKDINKLYIYASKMDAIDKVRNVIEVLYE